MKEAAYETPVEARGPKRTVTLDGRQFDAPVDAFDESSDAASDWFVDHLSLGYTTTRQAEQHGHPRKSEPYSGGVVYHARGASLNPLCHSLERNGSLHRGRHRVEPPQDHQ